MDFNFNQVFSLTFGGFRFSFVWGDILRFWNWHLGQNACYEESLDYKKKRAFKVSTGRSFYFLFLKFYFFESCKKDYRPLGSFELKRYRFNHWGN